MLEPINVKKLECNQCGHLWIQRTENPQACPNCKTRKWNEKGH